MTAKPRAPRHSLPETADMSLVLFGPERFVVEAGATQRDGSVCHGIVDTAFGRPVEMYADWGAKWRAEQSCDFANKQAKRDSIVRVRAGFEWNGPSYNAWCLVCGEWAVSTYDPQCGCERISRFVDTTRQAQQYQRDAVLVALAYATERYYERRADPANTDYNTSYLYERNVPTGLSYKKSKQRFKTLVNQGLVQDLPEYGYRLTAAGAKRVREFVPEQVAQINEHLARIEQACKTAAALAA